MNKETITILLILGVGGIFGVAYSASTIISDTGISTTNLTVTGTCTGCGGSGSFTSYSTVLNSTVTGTSGDSNIGLQTGNDGSVIAQDSTSNISITQVNGTVVVVSSSPAGFINQGQQVIGQTPDGVYKVILTASNVKVYKNNVLIQTLGLTKTQFSGSSLSTASVSISSSGKYISVMGNDSGGAINRLVIFEGS